MPRDEFPGHRIIRYVPRAMPNRLPDTPWRSNAPFTTEAPTRDLIVACSDGRFARSFGDFAARGLGVEKFAQLIVPGGPVFLARDAPPHHTTGAGAREQINFLIDALSIERVHLIQHDLCAFYLQVVGATPDNLRERQIEDLRVGAERLAAARPNVAIHRWIAGVEGAGVVFTAV